MYSQTKSNSKSWDIPNFFKCVELDFFNTQSLIQFKIQLNLTPTEHTYEQMNAPSVKYISEKNKI
jgi:hypothetical protein